MKTALRDLKLELSERKAKGGITPNDLRRLLERTLKEVCYFLNVKLAFKYNDENERRMSGELLSELKSTLNKKSPALKAHSIFTKLQSSNLISTTGSHDSGPLLSPGDVDVAYDDVFELVGVFECPQCSTFVNTDKYVNHEKRIYCRCGQKSIEWKE